MRTVPPSARPDRSRCRALHRTGRGGCFSFSDRPIRASPIVSSTFPWRGGWCGLHCAHERPPFHRGGSASTEAMPAASPSQSSEAARSASTGDRSGYPSLILLDLKLGRRNGCDFLKRLRADSRFASIPVVVFTTSDDQTDLATCYASGANGYVVKPGTFAELLQCTSDICRFWIDRNRTPYMVVARC